jgi:hypothetical protein
MAIRLSWHSVLGFRSTPWPGAGSNRRPSDFQHAALTHRTVALTSGFAVLAAQRFAHVTHMSLEPEDPGRASVGSRKPLLLVQDVSL